MMQWNAGAWFGSQLGASAWMLVAGALALRQDTAAALVVLALFLITNTIGIGLWLRRDRISPYAGIQTLLAVVGATGLAAVYVLDRAGILETIQFGARASAQSMYLMLILVVAALMISFYFRFGRHSDS